MDAGAKLIEGLLEDIHHGRLKLPVLPDVVIKVYRMLDDPRSSTQQVAKLISTDAGMSARLLQVANSPILRGNVPINDVRMAITRMGNKMVRSLVSAMLVEQLHRPKSAAVRQHVTRLWHHNAHVAAISYVLARNYTTLKPDEALLAGLIHDIGTLPIIDRAGDTPQLLAQPQLLDDVIAQHHTAIGKMILESWQFPEELVAVAAGHENLEYRSELLPEYLDVVIVANVHSYIGSNHPLAKVNWADIPAFVTLGLNPQQSIEVMKDAADEIRSIKQLFAA